MRSTTIFEPDPQLTEPPANLELVNWALRDNPAASMLMILIALSAISLVTIATNSLFVGLVATVAIAITMRRMFVPIRYNIGPRGIAQTVYRRKRRISWSSIRSCEVRGDGVFLCPDSEVTPITILRGQYIGWGESKDQLVALLRYYLGARVANI